MEEYNLLIQFISTLDSSGAHGIQSILILGMLFAYKYFTQKSYNNDTEILEKLKTLEATDQNTNNRITILENIVFRLETVIEQLEVIKDDMTGGINYGDNDDRETKSTSRNFI